MVTLGIPYSKNPLSVLMCGLKDWNILHEALRIQNFRPRNYFQIRSALPRSVPHHLFLEASSEPKHGERELNLLDVNCIPWHTPCILPESIGTIYVCMYVMHACMYVCNYIYEILWYMYMSSNPACTHNSMGLPNNHRVNWSLKIWKRWMTLRDPILSENTFSFWVESNWCFSKESRFPYVWKISIVGILVTKTTNTYYLSVEIEDFLWQGQTTRGSTHCWCLGTHL